jgi:DNA-3-methyladenine glycosylase
VGIDFDRDAPVVAPQLLGALITWGEVSIRINEVEAYTQDDPASHSFRGQTPRNAVMFGPPGHWYVYFTYGMHWCMNVVTGQEGDGQAVLIRGGRVETGLDTVALRRGVVPIPGANLTPANVRTLTDGPAKLAQALGVDRNVNGWSIEDPNGPRLMYDRPASAVERVTGRVGISSALHTLWRFCAAGAARRDPDRG